MKGVLCSERRKNAVVLNVHQCLPLWGRKLTSKTTGMSLPKNGLQSQQQIQNKIIDLRNTKWIKLSPKSKYAVVSIFLFYWCSLFLLLIFLQKKNLKNVKAELGGESLRKSACHTLLDSLSLIPRPAGWKKKTDFQIPPSDLDICAVTQRKLHTHELTDTYSNK